MTILGSSSSGNCAYLESDSSRILVDAGLSAKQIEQRLATIDRNASELNAILVTHEHSDHIQGLRVLSSRYRIPVYSNSTTREAIRLSYQESGVKVDMGEWRLFENGQCFAAGAFEVEPFSLPHDAVDPVGFVVRCENQCVVFLTDLGYLTQLAIDKARQADTLILETNYDVKMLQNDERRPWALKQRIAGRHGHLSNEAAAQGLVHIMNERLKHIYLSHLSQDCNQPELAESAIRKQLKHLGASHVQVTVTHPQQPTATEKFICQTLSVDSESAAAT